MVVREKISNNNLSYMLYCEYIVKVKSLYQNQYLFNLYKSTLTTIIFSIPYYNPKYATYKNTNTLFM